MSEIIVNIKHGNGISTVTTNRGKEIEINYNPNEVEFSKISKIEDNDVTWNRCGYKVSATIIKKDSSHFTHTEKYFNELAAYEAALSVAAYVFNYGINISNITITKEEK